MTRDHLMGYAPSADVSANCPSNYDEFDLLYRDEAFPFGLPRRVLAEMERERLALQASYERLRAFERKVHPTPDGTHVSSGGMTWVTDTSMRDQKRQLVAEALAKAVTNRANSWHHHGDAVPSLQCTCKACAVFRDLTGPNG